MRLAVKFYRDVENPYRIPKHWPAEVREIRSKHLAIEPPWVEMTLEEYNAYRAKHQADFDRWEARQPKRRRRRKIATQLAKAGAAAAGAGGALAALLEYLV